jgi:imidazoleglycerol-phosphate dehydratase
MSTVERRTRETEIVLTVTSGNGTCDAHTTDPFLDHMLTTLARYGDLDLAVQATGDLRHHLIEDVGIALGAALVDEVPTTATRYGSAIVPMDEALVQAAVDVGGRPFYEGTIPSPLYEHFLQSVAFNLKATLHVVVIRGTDRHHVVEAAIKAVGLCLRQALAPGDSVFSTKGAVELERLRDEAVLDETEELG